MHNGVMTIMSVGDSAQVVPSGSDAHPRKPVPALGCFPPATDRAAPLFFALTYNLVSSSLLICVIAVSDSIQNQGCINCAILLSGIGARGLREPVKNVLADFVR